MTPSDVKRDCPGRLVNNLDGRPTFLPDSLYPDVGLTPDIWQLITTVEVALGRLDGMMQLLPDPTILIRSFVRREAQLSSYIENTFAKYDELAEAAQDDGRRKMSVQAHWTPNAERAILAGVAAVADRGQPVNNALVRGLHECC